MRSPEPLTVDRLKSLVTRKHKNKLRSLDFHVAAWMQAVDGECIKKECEGKSYYIECGTNNGYSTSWAMLGLPPNSQIHTFDPSKRIKLWDELFQVPSDIKLFEYTSRFDENVSSVLPLDKPATFLIDGDHRLASIRQDWEAIQPYVKTGDVVLFHDIEHLPDCRQAFDEITGYVKEELKSPYGMGILRI